MKRSRPRVEISAHAFGQWLRGNAHGTLNDLYTHERRRAANKARATRRAKRANRRKR